jgi:hypothetical protein
MKKSSKKISKKSGIIIVLVLLAMIIGVLIIFDIMNNSDKNNNTNQNENPIPNLADIAPSLSESPGNANLSNEIKNSLIYNSEKLAGIIDPDATIGNWKAVVDEVNAQKVDLKDINFSISFSEKSFSSNENGFKVAGFYKIVDDNRKIIFYSSEEEINQQGNFLEAFGNINNNRLTLVYPQNLRVIIFERA